MLILISFRLNLNLTLHLSTKMMSLPKSTEFTTVLRPYTGSNQTFQNMKK